MIDRNQIRAVADLARALEDRGVLPDVARSLAERHGHSRLFVNASGQLRALARANGLYPVSEDDPSGLGQLADEIASNVPASDRGGPSREEIIEKIRRKQLASGLYAF